jgi:hypothetical protein
MNTGTAIGTFIFGFLVVVLIGVVIRRMLHGWKRRSEQQVEMIGTLPAMPDLLGSAIVAPTRGLYVGCTMAPDWLNRVTVGDLGYRCKAVLTRYPKGILLERSGTGAAGILVIRWRLPSGTEIDTGFRGDDRRLYAQWLGEEE